jgi:uncharacterized membrane protein
VDDALRRCFSVDMGVRMKRVTAVVLAIGFVVVAAAAVILGTTNIPPPQGKVEKVISDERLPR